MENIIQTILQEIFNESIVKVRHSKIKVKHMSSSERSKSKKYRVRNKAKLKLRMKKLKRKLKNKPKAKRGYTWNAQGKLIRKQKRVGVRKRH